jgi:hypothetical protein
MCGWQFLLDVCFVVVPSVFSHFCIAGVPFIAIERRLVAASFPRIVLTCCRE